MSAKKFRELNGLKPKENIRDSLTAAQLEKVRQAEGLLKDIIGLNPDYKFAKSILKDNFAGLLQVS